MPQGEVEKVSLQMPVCWRMRGHRKGLEFMLWNGKLLEVSSRAFPQWDYTAGRSLWLQVENGMQQGEGLGAPLIWE